MSFFARVGVYPPAGLFGTGHLLLLCFTVCMIALGLVAMKGADERAVRRVVRVCTCLLWALEAAKIAFVLCVNKTLDPNEFVPLYYCSITLYAGALSSLGHGMLRRLGDVFLATGGVVGGAVFLLSPLTSLTKYPAWHFISWHSFVLHGLMVFLGFLLLLRRVYVPLWRDILYHAGLVSAVCFAASLFNALYDRTHPDDPLANLMFISKDFPDTPISLVYHLCGPLYPTVVWLGQAFLPFLTVCGIRAVLPVKREDDDVI